MHTLLQFCLLQFFISVRYLLSDRREVVILHARSGLRCVRHIVGHEVGIHFVIVNCFWIFHFVTGLSIGAQWSLKCIGVVVKLEFVHVELRDIAIFFKFYFLAV